MEVDVEVDVEGFQSVVDGGSSSQIKSLVVLNACAARFYKDSVGSVSFYSSTKGNDWDLESPTCVEFVNLIGRKFSRCGRIYGHVDPSMISAANVFSDYSDNLDFDSFVVGVMDGLCREASNKFSSSLAEGYVVFSHYMDEFGVEYILVVMLGKKGGYDFNNDYELTPKGTESLNLKDFRQAACMDLSGFRKVFPGNEGDSYLYFIKGNSKSEFFNTALGCSDSIPGKVCVENLKRALLDYVVDESNGFSVAEKRDIRNRVVSYIEKKAGQRVHLSEIQHVIDRALKEDSPNLGGFVKFLSRNSEFYKVSEEFEPSLDAAKKVGYVEIKLPSGEFSGVVRLSAVAVGDSDADISVDKDFTYIRVKLPINVSSDLRGLNSSKSLLEPDDV